MEDFAALQRILKTTLLSPKNSERLIRVFYDAAKILSRREARLKKPHLKVKEVSSAVVLAESLHSKMFRFEAVDCLAECFGNITEAEAIQYFEDRVMGEVKDRTARTIKIDEDALKSLYKEKFTGKHVVATENYEQGRAKRLPWIRHTLMKSDAIYVHEENAGSFRRSYLYVATVSIPIKGSPPKTTYYVVVVRETKNSELKMITAYAMVKRNEFLKVIEPCFPMP